MATGAAAPSPSTPPDPTTLQNHRKNYSDELKRVTPFLGVRDVAACTAYLQELGQIRSEYASLWAAGVVNDIKLVSATHQGHYACHA